MIQDFNTEEKAKKSVFKQYQMKKANPLFQC